MVRFLQTSICSQVGGARFSWSPPLWERSTASISCCSTEQMWTPCVVPGFSSALLCSGHQWRLSSSNAKNAQRKWWEHFWRQEPTLTNGDTSAASLRMRLFCCYSLQENDTSNMCAPSVLQTGTIRGWGTSAEGSSGSTFWLWIPTPTSSSGFLNCRWPIKGQDSLNTSYPTWCLSRVWSENWVNLTAGSPALFRVVWTWGIPVRVGRKIDPKQIVSRWGGCNRGFATTPDMVGSSVKQDCRKTVGRPDLSGCTIGRILWKCGSVVPVFTVYVRIPVFVLECGPPHTHTLWSSPPLIQDLFQQIQ